MNTHAKSVSFFYKLIPSGMRELGEGNPFELGESRFIHQIYIYINTLKSAQKRRAAKGESASHLHAREPLRLVVPISRLFSPISFFWP